MLLNVLIGISLIVCAVAMPVVLLALFAGNGVTAGRVYPHPATDAKLNELAAAEETRPVERDSKASYLTEKNEQADMTAFTKAS